MEHKKIKNFLQNIEIKNRYYGGMRVVMLTKNVIIAAILRSIQMHRLLINVYTFMEYGFILGQ